MNGLHVGIIMDGNGRWANARGWPRVAGHRAGATSVRKVIEAAPDLGIGMLTLYAFSSDNWKRPRPEVSALMQLFSEYLQKEVAELAEKGVKLRVIGRRDRLNRSLVREIDFAERVTAGGTRMLLRLAVDYSAREVLLRAATHAAREAVASRSSREVTQSDFQRHIAAAMGADEARDLDLLIRTGGEQRISDFLLWEAAYAEFVFSPRMWPDFDGNELATAIAEFHHRDRRFGTAREKAPAALVADRAPLLTPRWLD